MGSVEQAMADWVQWSIIGAAAWLALVGTWWLVILPAMKRGPRGDVPYVLLWKSLIVYSRLLHRARYVGRTHVPQTRRPGPLIIVANHTGAVDPFLISAVCPFEIRWMMAEDMISRRIKPFLDFVGVIEVSRDGKDMRSAREAVRLLKTGAVIGIFPEGGITTPPRRIMPFFAGVGLIIARSKAPVLLTWVSGTPDTNDMTKSLITPSHARVQFIGMFDFADERDPKVITDTLRQKLAEISGWPMVEGEAVPRLVEQTQKNRNAGMQNVDALSAQPG